MIKGWFRNLQASNSERDITIFLNGLRGSDSGEIAAVVAMASIHRIHLNEMGILLNSALGSGPQILTLDEHRAVQHIVGKLTRKCQANGRPDLAAGMMVWLHSIRAFTFPEIRILAREMWGELSRGFDGAEKSIESIKILSLIPVPDIEKLDFYYIPEGLTPEIK